MFGAPCPGPPVNCASSSSISSSVASRLVYGKQIGPFTVNSLSHTAERLRRAFRRVKQELPLLYATMGSSGSLCCRAVRGSTTSWSNHAWGSAIDINGAGTLDARFDPYAMRLLVELYPYLHGTTGDGGVTGGGFYWAAGYSLAYEDSMHFETAQQVMLDWYNAGFPDLEPDPAELAYPICQDFNWIPTFNHPGSNDHERMESWTIQYLLRYHGAASFTPDGEFGGGSETAVETFQADNGLEVTGWMTPETWEAIFVPAKLGDSGDHITAYRYALQFIEGYTNTPITDEFDDFLDTKIRDIKDKFFYHSTIPEADRNSDITLEVFQALVSGCGVEGSPLTFVPPDVLARRAAFKWGSILFALFGVSMAALVFVYRKPIKVAAAKHAKLTGATLYAAGVKVGETISRLSMGSRGSRGSRGGSRGSRMSRGSKGSKGSIGSKGGKVGTLMAAFQPTTDDKDDKKKKEKSKSKSKSTSKSKNKTLTGTTTTVLEEPESSGATSIFSKFKRSGPEEDKAVTTDTMIVRSSTGSKGSEGPTPEEAAASASAFTSAFSKFKRSGNAGDDDNRDAGKDGDGQGTPLVDRKASGGSKRKAGKRRGSSGSNRRRSTRGSTGSRRSSRRRSTRKSQASEASDVVEEVPAVDVVAMEEEEKKLTALKNRPLPPAPKQPEPEPTPSAMDKLTSFKDKVVAKLKPTPAPKLNDTITTEAATSGLLVGAGPALAAARAAKADRPTSVQVEGDDDDAEGEE